MEDLLGSFFGGGRGMGRGPPRERRGDNVVHRLKVSLEEMYNGSTRKLSLARNIKCDKCRGAGTKSGKRYTCETCHGSGTVTQLRPLGPGMMQQVQSACSACRHTGYTTPHSDRCDGCGAKGLVPEKKVFEVHIERGHKNGSKVVLRGEAGCSEPHVQPGDVVFVLEQKQHGTFARVGTDLIFEKTLTLSEALCGMSFEIPHLDGRKLKLSTSPGEVIEPDSWRCVQMEGMPVHGQYSEKGNLYVHFKVTFPTSLNAATAEALRKALPAPPSPKAPAKGKSAGLSNGSMDVDGDEEAEEVHMTKVIDFDKELQARRQYAKDRNMDATNSSDDEEGGGRGGQRVQCAQQ